MGLPSASVGVPGNRDSLGGMGGSFQRKQDHSALQERIAALTQPMPGHETALVDFEKRSWLSAASAKVLVGIVAAVVIAVGGIGLLTRTGDEAEDVINPAGRNVHSEDAERVLSAGGDGAGGAAAKGGAAGGGDAGADATSQGSGSGAAAGDGKQDDDAAVVVSVQGKVRTPGLLEMTGKQRLGDAINHAGGALPGANLNNVNLAEKVSDGVQIVVDQHGSYVLRPGESGPAGAGGSSGGAAGGTPAGGSGGSEARGGAAGGKVNINSADATQLETLDGVGPATAKAIVEWREANGPFRSVEQLMEVRGIGPGKLAAMKDGVSL
ncbi:ComEA family DNA-binding protein [Corynebacterium sp. MSK039]|uniref:ComEA family DNA-binding protein n=1 Tax=Corynebacterium sp. MSK039 TaxID=3050193 RepID=UPI00254B24D8|nr:ComEA family DNA-binding protein [Corynebacterium sp. MSK039]MDK8791410.1 ComEA family DNA-binding protein [Corynebacterium sp. MSK039]